MSVSRYCSETKIKTLSGLVSGEELTFYTRLRGHMIKSQ